jgi:type VI secretion system protein ImpC
MSVSSLRFFARHRAPRVQLQYTAEGSGDNGKQLPFVAGVLADLSGNESAVPKPALAERKFMDIDVDNFDDRMKMIEPAVSMKVADKLNGDERGGELSVHLKFAKMDDFSPAAVARQVPSLAKLVERRQLLSSLQRHLDVKRGARALVEKILNDAKLVSAVALLGDKGLGESDISAEIDNGFHNAGVERTDLASMVSNEFKCQTKEGIDEVGRALPVLARTLQEMPDAHGIHVQALIGKIVAELEGIVGAQLNEILHHREFQEVEGRWRGLHYLVSHTETDEMLRLRVLNVSKRELHRDATRAIEFNQSQLFRKIYTEEWGTLGGQPFGLLVGDYAFNNSPTDVELLRGLANMAIGACAPFIAAADGSVFGFDSWEELPRPRDLAKIFDTVEYTAWRSLRENTDARCLALALPRVLARLPYGHRGHHDEELNFVEDVRSDDGVKSVESTKFVWMNPAFAMAVNINRAFKRYGWCTHIYGFEAGAAEQLPVFRGRIDGDVATLGPTEVEISDRREAELARLGFLPLLQRKNSDVAAFMSASSLYRPAKHDNSTFTALDQISSKLPYVFAVGRFAHYLQCICRDQASSSTHPDEVARLLNEWVKNYVDDNPETSSDTVKAQRPLAAAEVVLREIDSNSGYYTVRLFIRPHYQFEGLQASVSFEVRLATRT